MENKDIDPDFDATFGTSKPFEYWLTKPDNPIVYCLLKLDGKDFLVKSGYTVELIQKTSDHDTFSITVRDDALDSFEGYVMEHSKNILGKNISITYHHRGKPRQTFAGIIGGITNKKDNGSGYGKLCITGHSPSILLENGKDCQSFENKTLEQIVLAVCSDYQQEAKIDISSNYLNLANTKVLPYTVQYKESDYQFIRRMAIRHGEFFYYNGEKLIFGNSVQPLINLGQGIDLKNIDFEMKMGAQDFKFIAYDVQAGSKIEKDSNSIQSEFKESLFQSIAVNTSNKIYRKKPKMHFNHTGIQNWSSDQLEEAVRLEKERRENLVLVRGKSDNPELRIGGRAKLTDINGKAMETYRIIEIKHYHSGSKYYNEFVGIPDFFNASPYIDIEAVPKGEEQSARVIENNDPMGMGRVRVQFPWQEEKNQITPWIRTTTLYAGAGRGDYKIPEIGDEVLVNHESGNAEKPYVSGALYNGKETSGYHTAGNDIKAERTRSGVEELINDAEGSWKQSTPDGNHYLMDGQKNTIINVPNDFTINVGGNFNINVGQNVSFLVGLRAIYNIGVQMMMNTPILKYLVTDNYHLQSPKTLINGEGEIKIEAKETQVAGMENLLIHSNNSAIINSKGLVEVKGQNGTSNSNIANDYKITEQEFISDVVVSFRPSSAWKGEYAMDWYRNKDTSEIFKNALAGDINYNTNIGTTPKYPSLDASRFAINETMRDGLKSEYGILYKIPWKKNGENPVEYLTPWLCVGLFKQAKLSLGVFVKDKKKLPKSLVIAYEKEYFKIKTSLGEGSSKTPEGMTENPSLLYTQIPINEKEEYGLPDEVVIQCIKKIDNTPRAITVFADGKEAGFLRAHTNVPKKLDVLLINVVADFGTKTGDDLDKLKNKNMVVGKDELKKILSQICITPNFTETRLDLRKARNGVSDNIDLKDEKLVVNNQIKIGVKAKGKDIAEYLKGELQNRPEGKDTDGKYKYENHLLVFFMDEKAMYYDEDSDTELSVGGRGPIRSGICMMFADGKPRDLAHESLHALGLGHSFASTALLSDGKHSELKYTYKYKATDNIMDYGHLDSIEPFALWKWQWDIIRNFRLIKD